MPRNLVGSTSPASRRPPVARKQPRPRWRPLLEAFEDRTLLSTFTVNTLADTVDADPAVTSLREAIADANA